jgi:hypothetical protein
MKWVFLQVAIFALATGNAYSTVHIVHPDGSGDYPSIQTAINMAADGDTILLSDGVFTGENNRDIRYHGKAITVRSQSDNPEACIIDCEHAGRGFLFWGEHGLQTRLEGVTVRNGHAGFADSFIGYGGAIYFFCASVFIRNCIFEDNIADYSGGAFEVYYDFTSHPNSLWVMDCVFRRNWAANWGGAVFMDGDMYVVRDPQFDNCHFVNNYTNGYGGGCASQQIEPKFNYCSFIGNEAGLEGGGYAAIGAVSLIYLWQCTFAENDAEGGGALSILGGSELLVEYSILAFNTGGEAVRCSDEGSINIICSDVFGNEGGDWVGCLEDLLGDTNLCADPLFCGEHYPALPYSICSESPCAPENNPCDHSWCWGAWEEVGCTLTSVPEDTGTTQIMSWSTVKSLY